MNKKLITLAVAAAMTAPAAALAEATLYGKLNVSLDYADVDNVVAPTYGMLRNPDGSPVIGPNGLPVYGKLIPGENFEGWGMSGNGYIPGEGRNSRIGVKGSEDLGNGLKAIYQLEFGVNLNDTRNNDNVINNADSITYRNSFVGLAGSFGTALMGRHDTPMKISTGKLDLFADTMADYNGTVGFRDLRADNVVAYISPSWSGFQFAGAVIPAGGSTAFGAGNLNLNSDSIAEGYSLAGIYANGPFYASLAYESLGNDLFNTQDISLYGSDCPYVSPTQSPLQPYDASCDYESDDSTAWRVGLGLLDWNGFTLTGIYEYRDQEPGSNTFSSYTDPTNLANSWYLPGGSDEVELWQIQAAYAFGNNTIKAMYGQADYDSTYYLGSNVIATNGGGVWAGNAINYTDYDLETWAIGFDHNFSKRTKLYALYTDVDTDQVFDSNIYEGASGISDWSGFSLGMVHSF